MGREVVAVFLSYRREGQSFFLLRGSFNSHFSFFGATRTVSKEASFLCYSLGRDGKIGRARWASPPAR